MSDNDPIPGIFYMKQSGEERLYDCQNRIKLCGNKEKKQRQNSLLAENREACR